ncbi:MAG TPA: DUF1573 domain-containing protein [Phycisphaerales bacterium]|nr:DUF1573 domain-containing protein [Phycisphaerales bacterium]HMP37179.1 DUF1573 domain-containing protein [Phycisphaerales bacterium]
MISHHSLGATSARPTLSTAARRGAPSWAIAVAALATPLAAPHALAGPIAPPVSATGSSEAAPDRPTPPRAPSVSATSPLTHAAVDAVPPIRIDPPSKDFGFVRPLTENKVVFKLWNQGDRPLEIAAVTPSCKCTTTNELAGTVIQPGEYAELGAQIDAGAAIGVKGANIKVLVDGYSQVLTLSLRAEVSQLLRITPGYINAIGAANEQGRLVIEATDGQPFSICSIHGFPVVHAVSIPEGPQVKHVIEYDLTAFSPNPIPRYLVIETDHPDCPAADVLVRHDTVKFTAGIRGVLDMRGSFGRIAPGESAEMGVRFRERMGEQTWTTDVVGVSTECPDATVELLESDRDADAATVEARFRIIPREGFQGLLVARVMIEATGGRRQEFLAYGRVAPDGACTTCTP